jgi:hypothetical protein
MYDLGPRVITELVEEESIGAKDSACKAVQGTQTMKNPDAQGARLSRAGESRHTSSTHNHFITCKPIPQHPITGTDSRILGSHCDIAVRSAEWCISYKVFTEEYLALGPTTIC